MITIPLFIQDAIKPKYERFTSTTTKLFAWRPSSTMVLNTPAQPVSPAPVENNFSKPSASVLQNSSGKPPHSRMNNRPPPVIITGEAFRSPYSHRAQSPQWSRRCPGIISWSEKRMSETRMPKTCISKTRRRSLGRRRFRHRRLVHRADICQKTL